MTSARSTRDRVPTPGRLAALLSCAALLVLLPACGGYSSPDTGMSPASLAPLRVNAPTPDPRVGLAPGLFDAEEAAWNLRLISATPPTEPFVGRTNSDLAFTGNYVIQGNYDGIQIWDISDPASPESVVTHVCPASQSDVSVYENLLFVSGEGLGGRLDCGGGGVEEAVSHDRLRGIRIFDISDITAPEYVANVQTCRGSHTHTVLEHPRRRRERVHLRVRFFRGEARRGAPWLFWWGARRGSQHGAVPHRSDPGARRRPGERRDREFAPHFRGPGRPRPPTASRPTTSRRSRQLASVAPSSWRSGASRG